MPIPMLANCRLTIVYIKNELPHQIEVSHLLLN